MIEKALPTTKRIDLVGKREFAVAVLNLKQEIFLVHVVSLSVMFFSSNLLNGVYFSRRPQIAGLIAKEAPTKIPTKYSDFTDVLS